MSCNRFLRGFTLVTVSLTFASCSAPRNAASETPVELMPGNYRVTMGGGGIAAFVPNNGPGKVDDNICVGSSGVRSFPEQLARHYLAFGNERDCSLNAKERQGNVLGGKLSCATDPDRAPGGSMDTEYQGALSADRVELDGRVQMNLPASATANMNPDEAQQIKAATVMMENITFKLTAERTGDCQ